MGPRNYTVTNFWNIIPQYGRVSCTMFNEIFKVHGIFNDAFTIFLVGFAQQIQKLWVYVSFRQVRSP